MSFEIEDIQNTQPTTTHVDNRIKPEKYNEVRKLQQLLMKVDKLCDRCEWFYRFQYFGNQAWLTDGWALKPCTCKPIKKQKPSPVVLFEFQPE